MSLPRIDRSLQHLVSAGITPGAVMAVSSNGELVSAAAGVTNSVTGAPMTTMARFQLGCITKLMTSLVALELVSEGRLGLDTPIGNHLEELHRHNLGAAVRVRHLLSHTSGCRGVNVANPVIRYHYTWPKFVELLRSGSPLFAAGTVFNYEHTECVLLGELAERITGEPIQSLYRRMILDPLGIHCGDLRSDAGITEWGVTDHSFDSVSSQHRPLRAISSPVFWRASLSDLTMNVMDLVRLGEALAGFGHAGVFHPDTIALLRSPEIGLPLSIGGERHERVPIAFGLGCAQYGGALFGHNGSARGQTCSLRFDTSSRTVLAVAMNTWQPYARDMLCSKAMAAIHHETGLAKPVRPPSWALDQLAGHYVGTVGTVDVSYQEPSLECIATAAAPASTVRILLRPSVEGSLAVLSEAQHLTVGFFGDGATSSRGVLVGLNAYRRESAP